MREVPQKRIPCDEIKSLPPGIIARLHAALLDCGPFSSDYALNAIFIDERINPWRDTLITGVYNKTERVESIISCLLNKYNTRHENALVLLLHVLSDRISPEDACHQRLIELADALENEFTDLTQLQSRQSNEVSHGVDIRYNPFYYGSVIKDINLFVGRNQEIAEIYEAVRSSASVSIVGERRLGKSSLLMHLVDPQVRENNGLDASRFIFVYFDFLGYSSITPTELWRRLLTNVLEQIPSPGLATQTQTLLSQEKIEIADLEWLLKRYKDVNINLILLFDEFDSVAQNPNFDLTFFGGLRNLSRYSLSYIIASHRALSELSFFHPEAVVSPFFNIFRRINLGGFSRDEINVLLTNALAKTDIVFDTNDLEMLELWAGSQPFFLQMASYFLFDSYAYSHQYGCQVDYSWAEDRIRNNAIEHLRYYWAQSRAEEKLLLAVLSLLEPEEIESYDVYQIHSNPTLRRLRERVLIIEDYKFRLRIFSNIFKQWIFETVSLVPTANAHKIKVILEEVKFAGYQNAHRDTIENFRKDYVWLDTKAIARWLLINRGTDGMFEWLIQLLGLIG